MNVLRFLVALSIVVPASGYGIGPQPLPLPSMLPSVQPAPASVESHANVPIDCFRTAFQDFNLTFHQSILLCTNAKSFDPIHCMRHTFEALTIDQRVNLCQGATSGATHACFEETFEWVLSFDERIKLCNGAVFRALAAASGDTTPHHELKCTAPAHCFVRSLDLLLSQDQRVILCAFADSDDPVRCFYRSDDTGLSIDQRVRLCTQLTPPAW